MHLFLVDVVKQIVIPSVFVSEETATTLKDDYMYDKGWVWFFFFHELWDKYSFLLVFILLCAFLL